MLLQQMTRDRKKDKEDKKKDKKEKDKKDKKDKKSKEPEPAGPVKWHERGRVEPEPRTSHEKEKKKKDKGEKEKKSKDKDRSAQRRALLCLRMPGLQGVPGRALGAWLPQFAFVVDGRWVSCCRGPLWGGGSSLAVQGIGQSAAFPCCPPTAFHCLPPPVAAGMSPRGVPVPPAVCHPPTAVRYPPTAVRYPPTAELPVPCCSVWHLRCWAVP